MSLPEYSFQISGETRSPPSLILRLKAAYAMRCTGKGFWLQLLQGSHSSTYSTGNYAESTNMTYTHLLSHKYLPSTCSMVNCCVQSWLWTPYALHSDEGQVQVAISMPSSPEVPCYGIFAWRSLETPDNLSYSLCFIFSLSESCVGQEKWYRVRKGW